MESARVGLILDSSVIIAGERHGKSVRQILEDVRTGLGETDIGLSVVTIVEFVHGIYRAKTETQRKGRRDFVEELIRDVALYPVTLEIARLAGQLEGQGAGSGMNIAFEDLLIGATALHLGFGVATSNVRHFKLIQGLAVVQF